MKNKRFFSLKWKFALVFSSVFLLLLTVFGYKLYWDAAKNFESIQEKKAANHIYVAHALTTKSFTNFSQLVDLFFSTAQTKTIAENLDFIDKNWRQWQILAGVENTLLFDPQGKLLKRWGSGLTPQQKKVLQTIQQEMPQQQLDCSGACFQHTLVPLIGNGELIAVVSMARKFSDIIIEYKNITAADMGILIEDRSAPNPNWLYSFSGMYNLPLNEKIFEHVKQNFSLAQLLSSRRIIQLDHHSYELLVFPVNPASINQSPFFVVIEDITYALNKLRSNTEKIIFFGVIIFLASALLLLLVIDFSLKRISLFSTALPFLAHHKYPKFREKMRKTPTVCLLGYDELSLLNETAIEVCNQLETLEQQVNENTQQIVEKTIELGIERDFIQQLIDVAPVIIIIQKTNGSIISINKAGIDEFEMRKEQILGQLFECFIPSIETEHQRKLKQLREGTRLETLNIDGVLLTDQGNCHVSWLHSLIKGNNADSEKLLLTIGINITDRKRAQEEMLKMATEDPLTGLNNRRMFQTELTNRLHSANHYDFSLALFYLDLDQFKIINDTNGHEAGDELLTKVGKVLKQNVHTSDFLCRIGGDEFTIITQYADLRKIEQFAVKINQVLSKLEYTFNNKIYKVTISIGIAIYPQHGKTINELLSNADLAMYQAKELGGAQYHIFSPQIHYHEQLTQTRYWKDAIDDALINNHFLLLYQPILDIQANTISHYECLIRMQGNQKKIIMPDEFIGFAEELGLIGKIDRWVIKTAIKKQAELQQKSNPCKLAINLSGWSMNDETIFEDIAAQLNLHQVNPKQIIFEITETSAVSNFLAAQNLIKNIKSLGCAIALDDFGVGFSSFYYLKHLPVDYVKIDGSFIRHVVKNSDDKIFVKALTEVSQALGKQVVAEFVENQAILEVLRDFGIEYAQGYHIGKPAPLDF
jgi:diguanylate cyclase (GGDEF)-like protein/PAS domain S-box-containing protein